jgi:hypothetical protein
MQLVGTSGFPRTVLVSVADQVKILDSTISTLIKRSAIRSGLGVKLAVKPNSQSARYYASRATRPRPWKIRENSSLIVRLGMLTQKKILA